MLATNKNKHTKEENFKLIQVSHTTHRIQDMGAYCFYCFKKDNNLWYVATNCFLGHEIIKQETKKKNK